MNHFAPKPDLILLGAGHAHMEVLRHFAVRPPGHARITLVSREPHSPLAGLVAGMIRGEHAFDDAHVDLGALTRAAGARLIVATADGLDLATRQLRLAGRPPLSFDVLSINTGGRPSLPDDTGMPAKPIGQLLARLAEIEPLLHPRARLAVVGAGVGGTELALALAHRLAGQVRIALICAGATPVMDAPPRARAAIRDALVDAGVEVISGVRAGAFRAGTSADGELALSDGSTLDAIAALWAAGNGAAPFLAASGLGCDDDGTIRIDATYRSLTHPFVFAAGDCASRYPDATARGRTPRSAAAALRAGPLLARNLRRVLAGLAPRPPRRHGLPAPDQPPIVLAVGSGQAIGWHRGLSYVGPAALRWKQRADRAIMTGYRLSAVPMPASIPWQATHAPCAADTLAQMLAGLHRVSPARLPSGASVVQATCRQSLFLDDPFVFGQIAACAALAALPIPGARPWTAVGTAAWPSPTGVNGAPPHDLGAMLQGAAEVLAAEGCALTALQPEPGNVLALGFSVNFLMDPTQAGGGQALWAADIRPGDTLIVTKPIGSGIVLEADRRGLAKARWLFATLAAMRRPNGRAVSILRGHGAICWSGIGGRGLVGAITSLLGPARLTVALDADRLPVLPGARHLAAIGVTNTAAADNPVPQGSVDALTGALLADPQLCGGLLAAVPAMYAEACLTALRQAGHAGAIIGYAEPTEPVQPRSHATDDGREATTAEELELARA